MTAGFRDAESAARSVSPSSGFRAFTFAEALISIAVVALLIAISLPSLSESRRAARTAVCLMNHRQIVAGWAAYINDYHTFPFGWDAAGYRTHERWGWGGVNWYPSTGIVPGFNVLADRPLNPYLGDGRRIEYRLSVFRCPCDNGTREYGTDTTSLPALGATSVSGETTTNFGVVGTSYECNEWMYCRPGVRDGWGLFPALPNHRSNQSPDHVAVSPSRFVVLADSGPVNWMQSTMAERQNHLGGNWWHGAERGPMGFLDGSARLEKSGRLVCGQYSFHMIPFPSPNASWRRPGQP